MIDYRYYREEFGGEKISTESSFKRIKNSAEAYLNYFTFGRIRDDKEHQNLIKNCLCEMCDIIYDIAVKDGGKVKKSENTDGYSVSYVTERVDGQDSQKALEAKLYRITRIYLENTGLLYVGVC